MIFTLKRFSNSRPATTLVEILLYFVLMAVLLLAFLSFSIQIGDLYGETSNYYEVDYAVSFAHEHLEAVLLEATGVDAGTTVTGVSAGALGLTVSDVASSPTRFYMSEGVLYRQEGAGTPVSLSPTTVYVDSFEVTVLESAVGSVQIQIDGKFSATGVNRSEMEASHPIHWTFTLRTL